MTPFGKPVAPVVERIDVSPGICQFVEHEFKMGTFNRNVMDVKCIIQTEV